MAEYRAYIAADDGHFVGCVPLVCGDDAEATERAQRLLDGLLDELHVVLWSGGRLVVRLKHEPAAR
jgi:hypothetical protein